MWLSLILLLGASGPLVARPQTAPPAQSATPIPLASSDPAASGRLAASDSPAVLDSPAGSDSPAAPESLAASSRIQPEPSAPDAPLAELDADLLYDVLVAEVAMQRDLPLEAFPHYFAAAQRTSEPMLAELATRAAIAGNDQAKAEEAAAFWASLVPDSLQARQVAAYIILEGGKVDQAMPYLRAVMELSPDRRQGYLHCARLVARLDDPLQRLDLMRALIGEFGEDPDALLALAGLAAGASQPELARDYAERAAAQRPAWNRPPQFLVQLLVSEDRTDEAIVELERYFSQGTDDLELRTLYAQLLIEAKRYEDARAAFDTLLASRPDMPGVLFAAGVLSLQLKDYDAARDYLLRLRQSGERVQDATFMLGQTEEAAGQLEQARVWYEKVRGDKALDAQIRLASVEARLGQPARARERLQRLRDESPHQQPALYLIEGEILRDINDGSGAMAVYDQALEQFPDNPDLLYARALLAATLQQVDVLERDLRRVLSMDPDHADALNALGYTLADQTDRLDEAKGFISRALELEPDQPAVLDSMGWLLYRMGKPAEAEAYLRKALEQLTDGEIAAHLGEVLWALGRRDEARAVWQQALDQFPDHDYLLRVIERHPVSLAPSTGS
ncbi:tetratricopeptide repeat protein [Thiorhodovibrio litoralis]|nr:tetratricopeptide repeat protein [Thiorhodovibrio litoralis]